MFKFTLLALFVAGASAGIVSPVERCQGEELPLQVRITDCEGAPPCQIEPNKDILFDADFFPTACSDNAKFKLIVETPFGPILVIDAVIGRLRCDLPYSIGQSIRISDAFGHNFTVEPSVYDTASGQNLMCYRVRMHVQ